MTLEPEPFPGPERLFYVNLGGYDAREFLEVHRNVFVVASSAAQAKSRALKTVRHWREPHRDELYQAEQAFALNDAGREQQLFVHLRPSGRIQPLEFTCDYVPIE